MANYTTTKLSITAILNSNVAGGGVSSSGTITITPKKGYVLNRDHPHFEEAQEYVPYVSRGDRRAQLS